MTQVQEYRRKTAEDLRINVRWFDEERGCWIDWQPDINYKQTWMVVEWIKDKVNNLRITFSEYRQMWFIDFFLINGNYIIEENKDIRIAVMEAFMKYIKQ